MPAVAAVAYTFKIDPIQVLSGTAWELAIRVAAANWVSEYVGNRTPMGDVP